MTPLSKTRQQLLFQEARNQVRALKDTVRELSALSNPAEIAELLRELQDEMTAS